ncbi:extracellular serine proteinase-like [Ptychodera flava]|uniref:extracellular serine proteinase-like n=1 Tax=Ptychodera flava TaxID=63121 RepID=UPI003969DE7E
MFKLLLTALLGLVSALPVNLDANAGSRPSFVKRETMAPINRADKNRVHGEYIVKLRDDGTEDNMADFQNALIQMVAENGLEIEIRCNITTLLKGFCASMPDEAVGMLRWLDEVDFVEEDSVTHTEGISGLPWGLDRIGQPYLPLDGVYQSPLGNGSQVNVFVVDSGILSSHQEFGGRVSDFYDAIGEEPTEEDCYGHGTHCAGIIGGENVGVAPGVNLHSVRLLNCSGNGTTSMVMIGLDAIARSNMLPAVVSMSMGGPYSVMINLAVKRLTAAGFITVVAAGNAANSACVESPASTDEAITVGATNKSDYFAEYSNYGSCVDILAPGSDVFSAFSLDDSAYALASGTSMATPHVAGVAALLLEQNPSLTQDYIKRILMKWARSNVINLSSIPGIYRATTPNKLLSIPKDVTVPPPIRPAISVYLCEDTCEHAFDNVCDDGGRGAWYFLCEYGTDCYDCGYRKV